MWWIVQAFVFHLLFLGSIFVIYFRSPVLTGLETLPDIKIEAPAKRLVLFVTDGLRSSSFFEENGKYIPQLKEIILKQGMLGLSHTHVPTESRPGHIAIIAGLYEDPSAVTRGWKENPIDFDSVFNRSQFTWAWGAHDILSIFSKSTKNIKIDSYKHDLDFTGKEKTLLLDDWVFKRISKFLESNEQIKIAYKDKIVFFLHLLGLDSAGHIYKPSTESFYENLIYTQEKIVETYRQFENYFPDNRTVYILTSDHGMTNSGSHGAGDMYETETPLYIWGAGVKNWQNIISEKKFARKFRTSSQSIPLFEVEQAALAPLMSSLIGVSVPRNNYGKLPGHVLNVTQEYLALCWINNAEQMIKQYEKLLAEFENGKLSYLLPRFDKLEIERIVLYRKKYEKVLKMKDFSNVIIESEQILDLCLEGMEFYHKYYQQLLLISTTISILGWIVQLYLMQNFKIMESNYKSNLIFFYAFILLEIPIIFIFLQGIPATAGIYLVLPIFCWTIPIRTILLYKDSSVLYSSKFSIKSDLLKLFLLVIGSQLLIFSFIWREIITVAFFGFSTIKILSIRSDKQLKWIFLSIFLSLFPLSRGVHGQRYDGFLIFGAYFWFINYFKMERDRFKILIYIPEISNMVVCLHYHNNLIGVPFINLTFSWIFLFLNIIFPLFFTNRSVKCRVIEIIQFLALNYLMLSVSYEFIFIILLSTHLKMLLEDQSSRDRDKMFLTEKRNTKNANMDPNQIAYVALLYTVMSFFGTGNVASVSSFDINIVRCFITTFSPFVITFFVILKFSIPVIMIIALILLYMHNNKIEQMKFFTGVLMLCNLMGITSLFMVTNKGSWLEIGSSISRFVIMQIMTLVLFLVNGLVIILLKYEFDFNTMLFVKRDKKTDNSKLV